MPSSSSTPNSAVPDAKDREPFPSSVQEFKEGINWEFDSVKESNDIRACLLWEYARESKTLREIEYHWEEPLIQDLPLAKRRQLFPFRHPELFHFPDTPWQGLKIEVKKQIYRHFHAAPVVALQSVEMMEMEIDRIKSKFIEMIDAEAESKRSGMTETEIKQIEMRRKKGAKNYVFIEIDPETWSHFSNNDILAGIESKLSKIRPKDIPNPGKMRAGKKNIDKKAALLWLGAMRLRHCYQFKDAIDLAQNQLSERDWADTVCWDDACSNASRKLKELFPFLPHDEQPLCQRTWASEFLRT